MLNITRKLLTFHEPIEHLAEISTVQLAITVTKVEKPTLQICLFVEDEVALVYMQSVETNEQLLEALTDAGARACVARMALDPDSLGEPFADVHFTAAGFPEEAETNLGAAIAAFSDAFECRTRYFTINRYDDTFTFGEWASDERIEIGIAEETP
jgi:hypothetical protein